MTLVATQGESLAEHAALIEALREDVSSLKQATAYMMAPVQRSDVYGAGDGDASAPTIEGGGAGIAIRAPSGDVFLQSSSCPEPTDLCGVARDVKALMDRFGASP